MTQLMPDQLFDKIAITRNILEYNVRDILIGVDPFWDSNRIRLATDDRYKHTILGMYFRCSVIKDNILLPGYKAHVLKLCINKYIRRSQVPLPGTTEIVIYFRLGDVVCDERPAVHDKFLNSFDYIECISSKVKKDTRKITIVTNLAFCDSSKYNIVDKPGRSYIKSCVEVWSYSQKRVDKNKQKFLVVIKDIIDNFPLQEVDVYSSGDVDKDIAYLAHNGFIGNKNSGLTAILDPICNNK